MSEDVERLRRWTAAGGEWDVLGRTPSGLVVSLLTCDRGEEMGRITSSEPEFVSYVEERSGDGA